MAHALRFDPGKKWIYGFGIDWVSTKDHLSKKRLTAVVKAGILVGRLNKWKLGEYFKKNVLVHCR